MSNQLKSERIRFMATGNQSYREIVESLKKDGKEIEKSERIFLLNTLLEKATSGKRGAPGEWLLAQDILNYHWQERFKVYTDPNSQPLYLKVNHETNEVTQVSPRTMVQEATKIFSGSNFDCSESQMLERVERWGLSEENQLKEQPSSFALKNDPGYTFNRISIEIAERDTPMFDKICNRVESNSEAMKAFFWSIFDPNAAIDQYLWMTGDGEDGKGSLMRFLEKMLDGAYAALTADNKWWPADCVGKRLGVFNDINNTSFPMKSSIKQVTGGDRVTIERKYKDAFSAYLDIKFIFTTNKPINISGQKAERRRCIYVKFGKNSDGRTPNFEKLLWEERAGILFKCREAYRKLADEDGSIDCSYDLLMGAVEDFEVTYESIFEKCFVVDPHSSVLNHQAHDQVKNELRVTNKWYGEFKEWMKRVHGVQSTRARLENGQRQNLLVGIRFKNNDEFFEELSVKDLKNFKINSAE